MGSNLTELTKSVFLTSLYNKFTLYDHLWLRNSHFQTKLKSFFDFISQYFEVV